MTPQAKAIELVHKYIDLTDGWVSGIEGWSYKKRCALIAVDELIEQESKYNNGSFYPSNYWSEVKAEIEKI